MRIHVSLDVTSLAASQAFYAALFGEPASKLRQGYANFRLDEPPIHLALAEQGSALPGGVSHLGIELPDSAALARWHERLSASGVNFEVEDEAQCCFAQADKLWLSDPDGYRWEIWVRTGDHDAMGSTRVQSSTQSEQAPACCG